jgi:hypothetical protein
MLARYLIIILILTTHTNFSDEGFIRIILLWNVVHKKGEIQRLNQTRYV